MNAEGVAKSLFRGARAKATVRNTEIAKMWFEYKGVDYMTKIGLLKKYHDMACHNLFCYSRNYAMTEPKEGYETEWKQAGEEVKLLDEMIKEAEVPDADKVDERITKILRNAINAELNDDQTKSPSDLTGNLSKKEAAFVYAAILVKDSINR